LSLPIDDGDGSFEPYSAPEEETFQGIPYEEILPFGEVAPVLKMNLHLLRMMEEYFRASLMMEEYFRASLMLEVLEW
jgi:hypothetical protein